MDEPQLEGFLRREEVAPEVSWQILSRVRTLGADEFSFDAIGIDGEPSTHLDALMAELSPHSTGSHEREHLTARTEDQLVRPTPTWALNQATHVILQRVFAGGLFEYPAYEERSGWVEAPSFYARSRLMFSVVSHEAEAMLRLPADDYHAFAREVGIILHASGRWI